MRVTSGLAIVFIMVLGGFMVAGGNLMAFWQPAEYIIILGAAAGATVVGNSGVVLKEMWHQAKGVFQTKKEESDEIKELLVLMHQMLMVIRTKGLAGLDDHVENPWGSSIFIPFEKVLEKNILVNFIADNLRMLAMGKSAAHEVDALLEKEIYAIEQDLMKPSSALHATAEAMPGFGILAAVGGIVITMGYIDAGLAMIGMKVGAALIGTFLGIFFCYCMFAPISSAMKHNVERQVTELECIKAIIVSNIEGKTPLLAVDSGRRVIELDIKPSFATMEKWIKEDSDTGAA